MTAYTFARKAFQSARQRPRLRIDQADRNMLTGNLQRQGEVGVVRDDDRSIDMLLKHVGEKMSGDVYVRALLLPLPDGGEHVAVRVSPDAKTG